MDVVKELRDCRRKLSRVKDKLVTYDSCEDNLCDLRRQVSECEANADQAETLVEATDTVSPSSIKSRWVKTSVWVLYYVVQLNPNQCLTK